MHLAMISEVILNLFLKNLNKPPLGLDQQESKITQGFPGLLWQVLQLAFLLPLDERGSDAQVSTGHITKSNDISSFLLFFEGWGLIT